MDNEMKEINAIETIIKHVRGNMQELENSLKSGPMQFGSDDAARMFKRQIQILRELKVVEGMIKVGEGNKRKAESELVSIEKNILPDLINKMKHSLNSHDPKQFASLIAADNVKDRLEKAIKTVEEI